MSKKIQFAFLLILILAAFATLAFVIWPSIMYKTNRQAITPTSTPPEQVVQNFLADGTEHSSEYLSPEFITYLDNSSETGEWSYDLILCAEEVPAAITIYPPQISGNTAVVEVTTSFVDHRIVVELVKMNGKWLINQVSCTQ